MPPVKLDAHMGMMMRVGTHHVIKELEGIQQLCQGVIGLLPKITILCWQQVCDILGNESEGACIADLQLSLQRRYLGLKGVSVRWLQACVGLSDTTLNS